MLRRLLLLLPLIVPPMGAEAASFACAKAATPTETAICADPALSALDERLAAAYREAVKAFDDTPSGNSKSGAAVKADQRAWLGDRNACAADAACLRAAYERRLAVLGFRPDPAAPAATDRFVGRYGFEDSMNLAILALRNGSAAVRLSGDDPVSGRWTCDFEGIGKPDAQGRLVVGTPDAQGNGLVLVFKGKNVLTVPETDETRAAKENWCGVHGWLALDYTRKP